MKLGTTQPIKDWTRFRLQPRSGRSSQLEPYRCELCQQLIVIGQKYYDSRTGRRAHATCVQVEKAMERKP